MKDDRGELDLTKQVEDNDELVKCLRQRINELLAINKSHQQLMAKQIQENEELKKDNKALAKQIDDYFNMRGKGL
jgi:cell division protein FtsB